MPGRKVRRAEEEVGRRRPGKEASFPRNSPPSPTISAREDTEQLCGTCSQTLLRGVRRDSDGGGFTPNSFPSPPEPAGLVPPAGGLHPGGNSDGVWPGTDYLWDTSHLRFPILPGRALGNSVLVRNLESPVGNHDGLDSEFLTKGLEKLTGHHWHADPLRSSVCADLLCILRGILETGTEVLIEGAAFGLLFRSIFVNPLQTTTPFPVSVTPPPPPPLKSPTPLSPLDSSAAV
ncbi:uncharacterized protein [Narcine bancroftii]|uniref:uncharacterized protein isoform X2 n=1 Tax=Narcine bancroftii TaxID=1343680 RepID=UPI003831E18F